MAWMRALVVAVWYRRRSDSSADTPTNSSPATVSQPTAPVLWDRWACGHHGRRPAAGCAPARRRPPRIAPAGSARPGRGPHLARARPVGRTLRRHHDRGAQGARHPGGSSRQRERDRVVQETRLLDPGAQSRLGAIPQSCRPAHRHYQAADNRRPRSRRPHSRGESRHPRAVRGQGASVVGTRRFGPSRPAT
jgi:hypothetical protein